VNLTRNRSKEHTQNHTLVCMPERGASPIFQGMEDFRETARKAEGRVFRIRVEGRFDRHQADWFEGFDIEPVGGGETVLTGSLPDQAALHGLLKKLRDLGVSLISVNPADEVRGG
jgi:glycine/D-amino acid oxidase-like deaminating enzyme